MIARAPSVIVPSDGPDWRADLPPVVLSIVAPCYNEEEVLGAFLARVTTVCASVTDSYEMVLVDDGSTDRTWAVMCEAEPREKIVAVKLARNHGHQLALTAGLEICRGERVLIIDADLQDPPELLPRMMAMVDEGADVVFGQRESRQGESRLKLLTARIFYRVISYLSETSIPVDTGDFRLITRRALDVLNAMPERHRFVRGMVAWIGFKQVPLRYVRQSRHAGVTKYPFHKMARLAIDAVAAFSTKPLVIASLLAVGTSVFGVAMLAYAFLGWLYGKTVSGWTSMLGAVAIFNSAQLLMLGIIGEYLGRLYQEAKGRPLFIVEEVRTHAHREVRAQSHATQSSGVRRP